MENNLVDMVEPQRKSYIIWLLVAALLGIFTLGRWSVPLAAWLMPIFLTRFMRNQPLGRGFIQAWVMMFIANYISGMALDPLPSPFYALAVVSATLVGIRGLLPYLADRFLVHRVGGFWGTLVLPTAFVTWEYFTTLTNTNGSWGSVAYTQAENLPLIQTVTIFGIWGIVFLMYWTAAVVNWAWERELHWSEISRGAKLYAGVMAVILLLGGIRLAATAPTKTTVRVAAVVAPTMQRYLNFMTQDAVKQLLMGAELSAADVEEARDALNALDDELFALTEQEARSGAKFIFWAEGAANILMEDEEEFVKRGQTLARQENIYLGIAMSSYVPGQLGDNKLILINPTGGVVWRYKKSHLWKYNKLHVVVGANIPGRDRGRIPLLSTPLGDVFWESKRLDQIPSPENLIYKAGDGRMPVLNTPYGHISAGIGQDLQHPGFVRQAAKHKTDILFALTQDWVGMSRMHLNMAVMRAVEYGMTVVQPTINGIATVIDPQGRVIASLDSTEVGVRVLLGNPPFSLATDVPDEGRVLVAEVPTRGMFTLYTYVRDIWAWLCIIGFFVLAVVAVIRSLRMANYEIGEEGE